VELTHTRAVSLTVEISIENPLIDKSGVFIPIYDTSAAPIPAKFFMLRNLFI
jgi:hypothetical protein